MKKIKKVSWLLSILVFLLILIYLILPPPAEPPPLPESTKSNLPGDTVEIPHLYAYFTNLSRQEVMAYYQKYYSHSSFFNLPLPNFRLNHPPEYCWVVIRDTEHSSYLEEIVHPFRESFYVNGYEPANDPFLTPGERTQYLFYDGNQYKAKVLVLPVYSNPLLRILILMGAMGMAIFLGREIVRFYGPFRRHR